MPQKISYLGFRHTSSGGQRKQLVHGCRNPPMSQLEWVEELQRKNGDGIVVKGRAYGIRSIRVDGNDALAVYSAILRASEIAITEQRPILVEALTYRVGHNSTSDYSTKYRTADEIEYWKMARNPVNRFRKWVERNGWWSDEAETELRSRSSVKKQLLQAIQVAEKTETSNC
ncbi:2-oxoisovalerate dehydrogenase subunit alpha 1, mitochondrial [Morus notabilis]|uniref:2-oxoisovalerate dehydrogenase subunit alpha 1, mitochondrial n=1 Tax=Morus notabilis TaxID=981085 RepID=UPI000CED10E2|nr:2-oxoisovalerate dehydrogenase subunit alpha 1, mitochondrial [Morus notabilis]